MYDRYDATDIEVLEGLEPVRRRPGMYTQTERPDHLAQEVVDNSVDEALAGHASRIDVMLHEDGSLAVSDDGRGMPVDEHPGLKRPGVEVILTRLHAGGKFSHKAYGYSGGLHGVGVSVVNALSTRLELAIRRGGQVYEMAFANGDVTAALEVTGKVAKKEAGTTLRFWPDPQFFDSANFSVARLRHLLRAKAVLCPGLTVTFTRPGEAPEQWLYQGGLSDYLSEALGDIERVPEAPFTGESEDAEQAVSWALTWLPEAAERPAESYVNLIPTPQGGTHVNGLRSGLTEALRTFCEHRGLGGRNVRIAPEDVWQDIAYVVSVKLREPRFTGQTKDRLASRECATFVSGAVEDAFGHWLNQHPETGEAIAALILDRAQARLKAGKRVTRKKVTSGPALPGKLADCTAQDLARTELYLVEGDSAGGSAKQARDREYQAVMPLRGKILNTWEVDPDEVLASKEVHDISVALGVHPGSDDLSALRYGKVCILADADSDGAHIASLLCALFLRHFRPLVAAGVLHVAMPPLYRVDRGKETHYALDDGERTEILERLASDSGKGQISTVRFKGLGEMNPAQLRETVFHPDTRRLIRLTLDDERQPDSLLDRLLARGRAADRRTWLEEKGHLAEVLE